ncbi:MAG TPA: hypothetical protein VM577_03215 [Anaerovoracaceae bacterium]|nr:hypothetical protein [Anaerovoracaceae bacterium]
MNGSEWLASLPELPGADRDKKILDSVNDGIASCQWLSIVSDIPGNHAVFQVCDDAVHVDLDDGSRFRMQATARVAQQVADLMGASLITAKISDLAYKQANVILSSCPLGAGSDMVTTTRSKTYNTQVEKKRAGQSGIIRDCGKAWILDNALAYSLGAVNYGFYDKGAPSVGPGGFKMWQTVGTRHNALHTDYSQTIILMESVCELNGEAGVPIINLMKDPKLAPLLNYSGVLKYTRQPGV